MEAGVAMAELDEEAHRVFHWRVRRFIDLGFTLRQSRLMAEAQADWHTAEHLLHDGCQRDTAFLLLR